LGIETLFLEFEGHGALGVFKGDCISPDGGGQEIVAALSIFSFQEKTLDETR